MAVANPHTPLPRSTDFGGAFGVAGLTPPRGESVSPGISSLEKTSPVDGGTSLEVFFPSGCVVK